MRPVRRPRIADTTMVRVVLVGGQARHGNFVGQVRQVPSVFGSLIRSLAR